MSSSQQQPWGTPPAISPRSAAAQALRAAKELVSGLRAGLHQPTAADLESSQPVLEEAVSCLTSLREILGSCELRGERELLAGAVDLRRQVLQLKRFLEGSAALRSGWITTLCAMAAGYDRQGAPNYLPCGRQISFEG